MLSTTREQLDRYADDVAVLWDEAQDSPALLRFLSPFGRADLGRLTRRFRSAQHVGDLIAEGTPLFATWLATMVQRDGLHPAVSAPELVEPPRESTMMTPGLELGAAVMLGAWRLRTLVVAGSLKAPMVQVLGAQLVVAGDLETQLLVADGCVLVGGSIKADIVVCPASRLSAPERAPASLARPLGWQVGKEVRCRVFDSPRFSLSCPVKADVVVRGVGVPSTPEAGVRLRELMVPQALDEGRLNLERIAQRITNGSALFSR